MLLFFLVIINLNEGLLNTSYFFVVVITLLPKRGEKDIVVISDFVIVINVDVILLLSSRTSLKTRLDARWTTGRC